MVGAIGYQKIAPRPVIPPPIRACPNRGNDFLPNKLTAVAEKVGGGRGVRHRCFEEQRVALH